MPDQLIAANKDDREPQLSISDKADNHLPSSPLKNSPAFSWTEFWQPVKKIFGGQKSASPKKVKIDLTPAGRMAASTPTKETITPPPLAPALTSRPFSAPLPPQTQLKPQPQPQSQSQPQPKPAPATSPVNSKSAAPLQKKLRPVVAKKVSRFANPTVLDIDLIKDQVEITFNWRKNLLILLGFALLSIILIMEVYFTLYLWEHNEIYARTEYLRVETQSLNAQIDQAKSQAAAALAFKSKINAFEPVFNSHIYWTNFFKYLEENTLADVYFSDFNGDTSGQYVLHAFAKDFRSLSQQLKSFLSDPQTVDAKITNEKIVNNNQDVGVLFNLNLTVKRSLFNQ